MARSINVSTLPSWQKDVYNEYLLRHTVFDLNNSMKLQRKVDVLEEQKINNSRKLQQEVEDLVEEQKINNSKKLQRKVDDLEEQNILLQRKIVDQKSRVAATTTRALDDVLSYCDSPIDNGRATKTSPYCTPCCKYLPESTRPAVSFASTSTGASARASTTTSMKAGTSTSTNTRVSTSSNRYASSSNLTERSTPFPSPQLVGELCFQLDRRIFSHIFSGPSRQGERFYGFTIQKIPELIDLKSVDSRTLQRDNFKHLTLTYRYKRLLQNLRRLGYRPEHHALFSMTMVNKYGLFSSADQDVNRHTIQDPNIVRAALRLFAKDEDLLDLFAILDSLVFISAEENLPLFVF